MAKGNIGNLLQHFVALRVAERLVNEWDQPEVPIEYVDCYSMAPWETVTGKQSQGFVERIRSFSEKCASGDQVAATFIRAWEDEYSPNAVPEHPQKRQYPNTAVLLRKRFPGQSWRMRLHENDLSQTGNRAALVKWAEAQTNGEFFVEGDWQKSPLICNSPAPTDRPVFVMLDPFKIVNDNGEGSEREGKLPAWLLRFLFGKLGLDITSQTQHRSSPIAMTLFSYSDVTPAVADRIVQEHFRGNWAIERVLSGPWNVNGAKAFHQGWIVSHGMTSPLLGNVAQLAWDQWNQ